MKTDIQKQYENKTGEKATYRKEGADYHTLKYVRWLESRLKEEINWGHRNCTPDNCDSSGTDCPSEVPAPEQAEGKKNTEEGDAVCGLCGKPGADKAPHPCHWPGEQIPNSRLVHAACETEECRRAYACLSEQAEGKR